MDFDAGAQASTTGDLLGSSTTGDLLGTSDSQASTQAASSGGLLDFGSTPQPTENVLGSFGISTQQAPTPTTPTFTPTFKGVAGFTTALFGQTWVQLTAEKKITLPTPMDISAHPAGSQTEIYGQVLGSRIGI